MGTGLTHDDTLREVQKLSDMCFQGNAIMDTIAYALNTYLNMPSLYKFCHFTISHALPTIFSDAITEFMMDRNDRIYRDKIDGLDKFYNNIVECMEDMFKVFNDINDQISLSIDSAIQTNDKPVEDFLRSFYIDIATPFWKQAKVLLDGAKSYQDNDNLAKFNKDFDNYIVLPDKFIFDSNND